MLIRKVLLTLALLNYVLAASAATIVSYNRAAFQTALASGTVSGQNFDSISVGTTISTVNGVTYGASLGSPLVTDTYLTTTPPNGLGSTSVGFFQTNETATFTFSSAVTAFGIDVNTFAPTAGDYIATLNIGSVVSSKFDVFPGTATGQFIGFISDTPFTSIAINTAVDPISSLRYSYTLDTLVYGSATAVQAAASPEPSTISLVAFVGVLFCLCGQWFRRKLQSH
jgi:hypothetical protein